MTITILNESRRTVRVEADTLDENFDFYNDRSTIFLNDRYQIVQARVTKWEETLGGEFDVEAELSIKQFAQLKALIRSL